MSDKDLAPWERVQATEKPQVEDTSEPYFKRAAKRLTGDIAAPAVGASKLFTSVSAGIMAAKDAMMNGKSFSEAYDENLKTIRDAQNNFLKSSSSRSALGTIGEFGAASALPVKGVKGILGGAYAGAADTTLEEMPKGAIYGAGIAGTLGKGSEYLGSKIPEYQKMVGKAKDELIGQFKVSPKARKGLLQRFSGTEAFEKERDAADMLLQKSLISKDPMSLKEAAKDAGILAKQIHDYKIKAYEGVARRVNPKVNTADLMEEINNKVINTTADDSQKAYVRKIFSEITRGTEKVDKNIQSFSEKIIKTTNKVKLSEMEKRLDKIDQTVREFYDKPFMMLSEEQQLALKARGIVVDALDEARANVLGVDSGIYKAAKMEFHKLKQIQKLSNEHAWAIKEGAEGGEIGARAMKREGGGIGINIYPKIPTPKLHPLTVLQKPKTTKAITQIPKGLLESGQKLPYYISEQGQLEQDLPPWER
jgi:hypothetical protein